MGSEHESDVVMEATNGARPFPKRQLAYALGGALLIAVVVLIYFGLGKWAVGVGGAGLVLIGIVWVAIDPPPPSNDDKNSSGINFGN